MSTLNNLRQETTKLYRNVELLKGIRVPKDKKQLYKAVLKEKELKDKYNFFRSLTKSLEGKNEK